MPTRTAKPRRKSPARKAAPKRKPAKRPTRSNAASKSKEYNGHKNWQYWNVALWIGNDQPLYNAARAYLRSERTKDAAARALLAELPPKTPDGARFTLGAVRAALSDLDS